MYVLLPILEREKVGRTGIFKMINAFIFTKKYALREWKMKAPVKKNLK